MVWSSLAWVAVIAACVRTTMSTNVPCSCGHLKRFHHRITQYINIFGPEFCKWCAKKSLAIPSNYHLHEYGFDNLKYLEQLSEHNSK